MCQYRHAERASEYILERENLVTTQEVKTLFFGQNSDIVQLTTPQPIIFCNFWIPAQQCPLHISPLQNKDEDYT
jgi:hypothetical protein